MRRNAQLPLSKKALEGPPLDSLRSPEGNEKRLATCVARRFSLEAGGIEPPSRDNSNGGLYMHSRSFDLGPGGEDRHPPPGPSRLRLATGSTAESGGQPAVVRPARHRLRVVPRSPVIRRPCEPG